MFRLFLGGFSGFQKCIAYYSVRIPEKQASSHWDLPLEFHDLATEKHRGNPNGDVKCWKRICKPCKPEKQPSSMVRIPRISSKSNTFSVQPKPPSPKPGSGGGFGSTLAVVRDGWTTSQTWSGRFGGGAVELSGRDFLEKWWGKWDFGGIFGCSKFSGCFFL